MLPDNTIRVDDQTCSFLVFDDARGLVKQAWFDQLDQMDQLDYKCIADVYRTRIQPDFHQPVQYWYNGDWLVVSGKLGTSALNLTTFQLSKCLDFRTKQARMLANVWVLGCNQTCRVVDWRCQAVLHTFQLAAHSRLDDLVVCQTSHHTVLHDRLDPSLAVRVVNHDSHVTMLHRVNQPATSIGMCQDQVQVVQVVMPNHIVLIDLN